MSSITPGAMERMNRRTWRSGEALRWFRGLEGPLDAGEQACIERIAPRVRGRPILDLGVGAGRTTRLFLALSQDYVGIDYTPEMIRLAREKLPGVRFEQADARDLSRFPDAAFALVAFSFNGIDAVDLAGRRLVMHEAARVLTPDGIFFFSTMNRDGPDFRSREASSRTWHPSGNPLRTVVRAGRWIYGHALGAVRRARYTALEERDAGHAILLHTAHDSGILVYATTPAELRAQLVEGGFSGPVALVDPRSGTDVPEDTVADVPYFHVLAARSRAVERV